MTSTRRGADCGIQYILWACSYLEATYYIVVMDESTNGRSPNEQPPMLLDLD